MGQPRKSREGLNVPSRLPRKPINNKSSLKIHTERRGSEEAAQAAFFHPRRPSAQRSPRNTEGVILPIARHLRSCAGFSRYDKNACQRYAPVASRRSLGAYLRHAVRGDTSPSPAQLRKCGAMDRHATLRLSADASRRPTLPISAPAGRGYCFFSGECLHLCFLLTNFVA